MHCILQQSILFKTGNTSELVLCDQLQASICRCTCPATFLCCLSYWGLVQTARIRQRHHQLHITSTRAQQDDKGADSTMKAESIHL